MKGGEVAGLAKPAPNWCSVIEEHVFSPGEPADRKRGQGACLSRTPPLTMSKAQLLVGRTMTVANHN